jgi:hypothetical protein
MGHPRLRMTDADRALVELIDVLARVAPGVHNSPRRGTNEPPIGRDLDGEGSSGDGTSRFAGKNRAGATGLEPATPRKTPDATGCHRTTKAPLTRGFSSFGSDTRCHRMSPNDGRIWTGIGRDRAALPPGCGACEPGERETRNRVGGHRLRSPVFTIAPQASRGRLARPPGRRPRAGLRTALSASPLQIEGRP